MAGSTCNLQQSYANSEVQVQFFPQYWPVGTRLKVKYEKLKCSSEMSFNAHSS